MDARCCGAWPSESRSSGAPAIDDTVRPLVQGQANYPPFLPDLARDFGVVEIRRTWNLDMAIRLY